MIATTGGNLPSLTALRFFAAALVALFHGSMSVTGSGADGIVRFGYVGVTFFFVLSGFVLTWTWKPDASPRQFYLRRFARVYPAHLLTALIALSLGLLGVISVDASPVSVPLNLSLLQSWVPDYAVTYSLNGPSWSLSDEIFFYAVFPLLVGWVGRPRRPWLALGLAVGWLAVVGVAVVALAPSWSFWLYSFPAYRVGEFVIGVALASLARAGWRCPVPVWAGALATAACYLALWPLNAATHGLIDENLWLTQLIVLPGFAVLIAAAATHDLSGRGSLLHWGVLRKLGQWSFALYLLHTLVMDVGRPLVDASPSRALAVLGLLIAAQLLAAAMFEWFERPVERRIRAWGHQRESLLNVS